MSSIIPSTYEILEKIGSGGGGNVFLANHLRLKKKVVLKEDKRKLSTKPEILRREVDVLKDLSHTYIPQVYDYFVEDGSVYTVMDYIEGESLDKVLKREKRIPQAQVIKWARELLDALCYLHNPIHGEPPRGIIHSDIKPSNIMLTQHGNICLIDYNIALALGEENSIGKTEGYSSPEHYGLDYSTSGSSSDDDITVTLYNNNLDEASQSSHSPMAASSGRSISSGRSSSSSKKRVVPNTRSDIYSLGATLYHLLKGTKPAGNSLEVEPLSSGEFSRQIVQIITKAMNPNQDLRFQSAEEMLEAFNHLRENDQRALRLKKEKIIAGAMCATFFISGGFTSFIGLKRMEAVQKSYALAEYSANALRTGDVAMAIDYALQALPEKRGIFTPHQTAEAQKALTDALGVYDLSDGFKSHMTVELPSAPLFMEISTDGKIAACVYAHNAAVFDTETAEIIATLPANNSALAEVRFLDDSTIIYAGEGGIQAYDITRGSELWRGKPATGISISADGKRVATVYRDETFATVYNAADGRILREIHFGGKSQHVVVNDVFANPNDNLFALNQDGTLLGVSFADGSLWVYDLRYGDSIDDDMELLDESSGFTRFEGGFFEQYFAFSASNAAGSILTVVDIDTHEQTGGFASTSPIKVQADQSGVFVQKDNFVVRIHPVTGEQIPLVTTYEKVLRFARDASHTLMSTKDSFLFFDANAKQIARYESEYRSDFLQIAQGVALIGSLDTSVIRIMRYENHPNAEMISYDPSYRHNEARISTGGQTAMLFSYEGFRLYEKNGQIITEIPIPDADQLYDQQYHRGGSGSWLEVIYNDGMIRMYSAEDGRLLRETTGDKPDLSLYEEFFTDTLRIESPLHGGATAYDIRTGKVVRELDQDAYLTYVTQAGEYIITEYITGDGYRYGWLLNKQCEVLAYLPYLCDFVGDKLIFDYPTGNLRESCVYGISDLIRFAR